MTNKLVKVDIVFLFQLAAMKDGARDVYTGKRFSAGIQYERFACFTRARSIRPIPMRRLAHE